VQSELLPVQWHGRLAVVTMPEEIDMANSGPIQQGLLSALRQRPTALVVDMSPTTFCDSAGVRAIMLTQRQAAASNCHLRLVISSPGVRRVFSIIGADQLAEVHSVLASALRPAPEAGQDGHGAGNGTGPESPAS
jgi:anti-sigma B factor antagonist